MIVFPVNVVLNVVLVHYTPLGLLGSPAALSITYWLCFLLLCAYTYLSPAHTQNATWGGIQLRATLDPKSCLVFLKLALPGILMVGTEWCVLSSDDDVIQYRLTDHP
jgi:MATE family multidrug resistance protein